MDRTVARTEETLAQRIVIAPYLLVGDTARARLNDWLAEIAGTSAGAILAQLLAEYPRLRALLVGIAEGSPYLWDLARADPARVVHEEICPAAQSIVAVPSSFWPARSMRKRIDAE